MKSILLATTNDEHRSFLTELLKHKGYFVIQAGDAELAVAVLNHGMIIDAVIADRAMAGFWKLLETVRSRRSGRPPVIVLAERVAVADYLGALSAGAFDLFFWPVRPVEFLRVLESALRKEAVRSASISDDSVIRPSNHSLREQSGPAVPRIVSA